MNDAHVYTPYHPRWLRRRMSTYWWLERPAHLRFILREGSCMFVGWFTLYLLWLMDAVRQGAGAYEQFLVWSATPWVFLLNLVTFGFLIFHAITFFQAAPQAMVVRLGGRRVPGSAVLAGHYAGWIGVSLIVGWLLMRSA